MSREEVDGIVDSAEVYTNFRPHRLGPMSYRAGSEYLGAVAGPTYLIDFLFARGDTAVLEMSNLALRIWESDTVLTRVASTSTVSNGTFDSDLSNWTDNDQGTAISDWKTGGYMSLIGDGAGEARRYQTIVADTTNETALRITISDAPVRLRLGYSVLGGDIFDGTLDPGVHSLAFTATSSSVTIAFSNLEKYEALVDSVEVESAGIVSIPHSIPTSALSLIRPRQSADVVFCSCKGYKQFKIERRMTRSWSVVEYETQDGPFGLINTTEITMTAAAVTGDTTITASESFFDSDDHLGMLIRHDSVGQFVTQSISGEDQFTDPIRVNGIDDARQFTIEIPFSTATWTLQRSIGAPGSWEDRLTYTTSGTKTFNDTLDNVDIYYRVGIKTGDYTSGSGDAELDYPNGSITGYAKITAVNSGTSANIKIYKDFGSTSATPNWYEGEWSDGKGWPSATSIYESRVGWWGKNAAWASVSDNYYSFDDTIEGDTKAFKRTIGFGPVDSIAWAHTSTRLLAGTAGSELALRSTTRNEALTATTANFKELDTEGSAPIDIAKIGRSGFFVEHSGTRVNEIMLEGESEYAIYDLMTLHPEIAIVGIKKVFAQMQPEKIVHCILNNGDVIQCMKADTENVRALYRISTDGDIEDGCVNRGSIEDQVYYVVNRTGGRYLEKFAQITEARGASLSKHYDSFKTYTSPGTATLTGLDHLEGKTVYAWADGKERGSYTVSSGSITIDGDSYTNVCVGLRHTAQWKSVPLSAYSNRGATSNAHKRVTEIGFRMLHVVPSAVQYGAEFTDLYDLPKVIAGEVADVDQVMARHHEDMMEFDGDWDADSRICLQATGPVTFTHMQYQVEPDR